MMNVPVITVDVPRNVSILMEDIIVNVMKGIVYIPMKRHAFVSCSKINNLKFASPNV